MTDGMASFTPFNPLIALCRQTCYRGVPEENVQTGLWQNDSHSRGLVQINTFASGVNTLSDSFVYNSSKREKSEKYMKNDC